ncbi:hypothetical protein RND81_04G126900 [Saponaria officinalis]|uniref:Uncharacterized protein n=1 Tax=Saponaria officinalis TaxID=3572 RepID=A0AAW1LLC8_SAPOF
MLKLVRNINGVQLKALYFNSSRLCSTSFLLPNQVISSFSSYLVQNLGFSHPQSLATSSKLAHYRECDGSKKLNFTYFASNANLVIDLLKDYGFNQDQIRIFLIKDQIRILISYDPRILSASVEKTLKPKLKFFKDEGFSESDLVQVLCENPSILKSGLNSRIVPTIRALKEFIVCYDDVILFLKKSSKWIVFSSVLKYLVKNVALLQSYGIPIENIRKRLVSSPNPFLHNSKSFEDITIRVEQKLGIPRQSGSFMYGIHLLSTNSEKNIESKMEVMESFGWKKSDILTLCRRCPLSLAFSEASIKRKLEFLVNELGLKPAYIASNFVLLTCSLEKRVMPRHKIVSVLKEKGLIKANASLDGAVRLSESRFLNKFVLPFEEVHQLYTQLTGVALDTLHGDVAT